MKKPFNLYEELKNQGFVEATNEFGFEVLRKNFEKTVEVAWYGKQTRRFSVDALFSEDKKVVTVKYSNGKVKVHLSDKRAYNAINQTLKNNGF